MTFQPIYLASRSPRRRELLQQIGVGFTVVDAPVDEAARPGERAVDYVVRIAKEKALAGMAQIIQQRLVMRPLLAADTAVVVDGTIFGKPDNAGIARSMLRQLSGRTHQVMTAVALLTEQRVVTNVLSVSDVTFTDLTEADIDWYIASGEGEDKAGSYAVQGIAALFIKNISGSYSGIMGLPVYETGQLLAEMENQYEQRDSN